MSTGSSALLILGVLGVLGGVALIAIDVMGKGDTSGIDVKDVGILIVGVLLAVIGGALSRRRPSAPSPP
ncbi:MAG: hypothetical protein ACREDK_07645 [Thermoplasmata archaeon]